MTNTQIDAIEVQNTVVGEQWTLSPGLKLLGQALVEATDCAGTLCHSHQLLSDLSDGCRVLTPRDIHLGECFGYLRFIAVVAFEHLGMKLPFPISGHASDLQCVLLY